MNQAQQPGINLVSVFLESASFSHRSDPFLPLPPELKNAGGNAMMDVALIGDDRDNRAVRLTVSSKDDPLARYDFTVVLVALFNVRAGDENMPVDQYVAMNGAALVFPFAREAIASLTSRGRFGPIWLNPVNIHAVMTAGQEIANGLPASDGKDQKSKTTKRKSRR